MASLTESAYYTRKILKWSAIGLVVFFLLKLTFSLGKNFYYRLRPPRQPEPTVVFGKLPALKFPETTDLPVLTYNLETISGGLEPLDQIQYVYFIPKKVNSYLTLDQAKEKAARLGFKGEPINVANISPTTFQWRTGNPIASSLTMEIVEQTFNYRYDFERDQTLINNPNLVTVDQALRKTKSFLSRGDFLPEDINSGPAEFIYLNYNQPEFNQVLAVTDADFIRVNLYRKAINNLEVFPADPDLANVSALISRSEQQGVVELKYSYFTVQYDVAGTYPLKSSTEAWTELKQGKGYIARLGENTSNQATIRKVYLGYYDPPDQQNFLQPIFVFEGDQNFLAYIAAVKNEWVSQN